jgi:hypothetical protein
MAKSSQETPPPSKNITESPEVMEIHSDWHTPFTIYFRTRACQKIRLAVNPCVVGQDSTL